MVVRTSKQSRRVAQVATEKVAGVETYHGVAGHHSAKGVEAHLRVGCRIPCGEAHQHGRQQITLPAHEAGHIFHRAVSCAGCQRDERTQPTTKMQPAAVAPGTG